MHSTNNNGASMGTTVNNQSGKGPITTFKLRRTRFIYFLLVVIGLIPYFMGFRSSWQAF
jgi:hypothetical protein